MGARERTVMAHGGSCTRGSGSEELWQKGFRAHRPRRRSSSQVPTGFESVLVVNGTNRPPASTRSRSVSRRISAAKSTREFVRKFDELPSNRVHLSRIEAPLQEHCASLRLQIQMKFSVEILAGSPEIPAGPAGIPLSSTRACAHSITEHCEKPRGV